MPLPNFRAAVAASALLATTSGAFAHMTFETETSAPGEDYVAVLNLTHGCEGAATDTVRVQVPEGFYNVRAMPNTGWAVMTSEGEYASPIPHNSGELTGGVREIVWSGGMVVDDEAERFAFSGTFAADLTGSVSFIVEQLCGSDTVEWTPSVSLGGDGETTPMAHSDQGGEMMLAAASTREVGDLVLSAPFTRATLPNAQVGGGYLSIENTGSTDEVLIGARSPMAGEVQLHAMDIVDDVMRMRQVSEGVLIRAGETVALAPGGLHLMMMDITEPFLQGETVPVTLVFETAGEIEIDLAVAAFGASVDDHTNHGGHR